MIFCQYGSRGSFPDATSEINEELGKIIAYKRIGLFTLAVYAYFSYQLFYSLESAVNTIFGTHGKRPLLTSLLLSLLVINVLIVFIMISFGATSLIGPLAGFFPGLRDWDIMTVPVGIVLPAFLVFIIASGLYMVLPHTKVRTSHALTGALFTAVLFEAAKHVFTYYIMMKITEFGTVYGPLTAFVIFLLWIFFAACIFLLGAELVHNLHISRATSDGGQEDSSCDLREN